MKKYKVLVTVWSDEFKHQIKVVAGEFDNFVNARIFANAYKDHFSTSPEIVEYIRK